MDSARAGALPRYEGGQGVRGPWEGRPGRGAAATVHHGSRVLTGGRVMTGGTQGPWKGVSIRTLRFPAPAKNCWSPGSRGSERVRF